MRTAWLIYNPAAGKIPAKHFLERAAKVLRSNQWDVSIVETGAPGNLQSIGEQAVAEHCDAVFVAGGDGTVGTVASALAGSDTALGVLPTGTANVFAQELGLPRLDLTHLNALEHAALELAKGSIRRADLGRCNGQPFLLWAGLGLDAQVVNAMEPRERWEKAFATTQYATQALWNSIQWEGMDLQARAASYEWRGKMLVAVACNIPAYAGGLLDLAPGAKIDDGLLDFWLIGGESLADALLRVFQIFRGTHIDAPGVIHFREREACFKVEQEMYLQLDGEPHGLTRTMTFSIEKQALPILVPNAGGPRLFSSSGTDMGGTLP